MKRTAFTVLALLVVLGVRSEAQTYRPGSGGIPTTRTISTTAPLTGGGDLSANRTFAIPAATDSVAGYMTAADHTTLTASCPTTRTISTTAPLTGGGSLAANRTISIPAATDSVNGYLSAADHSYFSNLPLDAIGDPSGDTLFQIPAHNTLEYEFADYGSGGTGSAFFQIDDGSSSNVAAGFLLDLQVNGSSMSPLRVRNQSAVSLVVASNGRVDFGNNGITLKGSSSGTVGLKAAAAAGSTTYTLPAADGSAGQAMITSGAGALSFGAVTAIANGALIDGYLALGTSNPGSTVPALWAGGPVVLQSPGDSIILRTSTTGAVKSRLEVRDDGSVRFLGDTSGYTGLKSPTTGGSTTFTLPSTDGSSGQCLTTNGSTVLTFATPASSTAFTLSDSATTTATTWGSLTHTSSGTAGAGFGQAFRYIMPSSTGVARTAAELRSVWTSATNAAESASFRVALMSSGSAVPAAGSDQLIVGADGGVTASTYFGGPAGSASAVTYGVGGSRTTGLYGSAADLRIASNGNLVFGSSGTSIDLQVKTGFQAGTAGAPGFFVEGDSDTGWHSSAANTLDGVVGGAIGMEVSAPADTQTSLLIRRNHAGSFSLQRVVEGAADSCGSGLRCLAVAN